MSANEIINIIESVAPLTQQEGWDNSGLQIGNRETEVSRCLLCTDITEAIVDEAIQKNCKMILSHHPLLFHGLKTIEGRTFQERVAIRAIQNGLVLYSSHTAMDCYLHGVSGRMAEKLGIEHYEILSRTGSEECGLGVVGNLTEALDFEEFIKKVKTTFSCPVIRYTHPLKQQIKRVAMCGGAGSEFAENAVRAGADVYISADFKYHEFQAAEDKITVMDIGHFESEQYTKEIFAELLRGKVECLFAVADRSPVLVY